MMFPQMMKLNELQSSLGASHLAGGCNGAAIETESCSD
jgi:hypothetical protein